MTLKFLPEATSLDVPILKNLARNLGRPLTFYDLETTTFLGNPTSGITEVAAVHIHPDGTVTQQSALVNPENPISEKASEVTGITQDMVNSEPNWSVEARDYFLYWSRHHTMLGFNNLAFDDKYIIDQNLRYGSIETKFHDSRDVRSFWRLMMLTLNGKGKLGEIAQRYGLSAEGAHRAIFDVRMTARVFENMLMEKGLDFFDHPGGKLPANKKLESIFIRGAVTQDNPHGYVNQEERVLQIVENCGYTTRQRLMMMTGIGEFDLSTMLGDMVFNDQIDYSLVEDDNAQAWLAARVPLIIEKAWIGADRGKLKVIFDTIATQMRFGNIPSTTGTSARPNNVDYLQLRVYLKAQGYYAAMDKSPVPLAVGKEKLDA